MEYLNINGSQKGYSFWFYEDYAGHAGPPVKFPPHDEAVDFGIKQFLDRKAEFTAGYDGHLYIRDTGDGIAFNTDRTQETLVKMTDEAKEEALRRIMSKIDEWDKNKQIMLKSEAFLKIVLEDMHEKHPEKVGEMIETQRKGIRMLTDEILLNNQDREIIAAALGIDTENVIALENTSEKEAYASMDKHNTNPHTQHIDRDFGC